MLRGLRVDQRVNPIPSTRTPSLHRSSSPGPAGLGASHQRFSQEDGPEKTEDVRGFQTCDRVDTWTGVVSFRCRHRVSTRTKQEVLLAPPAVIRTASEMRLGAIEHAGAVVKTLQRCS